MCCLAKSPVNSLARLVIKLGLEGKHVLYCFPLAVEVFQEIPFVPECLVACDFVRCQKLLGHPLRFVTFVNFLQSQSLQNAKLHMVQIGSKTVFRESFMESIFMIELILSSYKSPNAVEKDSLE